MIFNKRKSIFIIVTTTSLMCFASDKETKGLLPEIKIGNIESENENRAYTSEMMITRAETKALESLTALLLKKKGSSEEPYLLYRLAELHMKRSKSGRFFDMQRDMKSAFPIPAESSAANIRKAILIYNKLITDFPKFQDMDSVIFNNAFANQQIGLSNVSIHLYKELLERFKNSPLTPDARIALGELLYNQQNFKGAIEHFVALEAFPESRVYSYGMYKAAWTYYNLQSNDEAVKRLISVIRKTPPIQSGQTPTNKHNLRKEALRDLCIFIGETYSPSQIYPFFEGLTTQEELAQSMLDMGKLYISHSKFKDMSIFVNAYLKEQTLGSSAVKLTMLMVEANENLKARDSVIENLDYASELCSQKSKWRNANSPDEIKESCDERFRRDSLEIASKWWDIWLKNKQHKEFSLLTEKVFAIILKNDDPLKPDLKTRYAYAELLFQQEKYSSAAIEYKKAAQTVDLKQKHDADYGVLFSLEKALEKDPNNSDLKFKRMEAAQYYVLTHPTGENYLPVQFKIALLQYESQSYTDSFNLLTALLTKNPPAQIKIKCQDLVLDILNIQKNYKEIRTLSRKILSEKNLTAERTSLLTKIGVESHFSEIQVLAASGKTKDAIKELQDFIQKNPKSELTEKAWLQTLSIQLSESKDMDAAETALKFAAEYPANPKSIEAMKETSQIYTQSGQFNRAIQVYEKLILLDSKNKSSYLKSLIDLSIMERQYAKSKTLLEQQLKVSSKNDANDIIIKLLELASAEKDQKFITELENKILQIGLEPQTTQIMIRKAQSYLDAKNLSAAFELSLKANSRNSKQEIRAPARLIQAQILEIEHLNQSVKTKLDRLPLVLGMKTEKFDKAHTAYFSAAKMAGDADIKILAMEGLDRIYIDYINSIQNAVITDTLTAEENTSLRLELSKIVEPMKNRQLENEAQLKLVRESARVGTTNKFNGLLANETAKPSIEYPAANQVPPLLEDAKLQELALARKTDLLEKSALVLFDNKSLRHQALTALSVVAEQRNQLDKALWLAEQSINEKKSLEYAYLQRARIVYLIDNKIQNSIGDFQKAEVLKKSSSVLSSILGISSFSSGNTAEALEYFSFAKKEDTIKLEIGSIISEAFALKGDPDKALSVIKEHLKVNSSNVNFLLQEAHVLETYKTSPAPALESYAKALKVSKNKQETAWLEEKIKYLKTVILKQ